MIRAVFVHVHVDICDCVGVMECGCACRIQLMVAILVQLFELLKLLICWLREHVYHWFNLLSDLSWIVEMNLTRRNHSRLKLLSLLLLWKDIDRTARVKRSGSLRNLIMKAGYVATTRSLASRIIVHWVGFLNVICVRCAETALVFIGTLVDVEIGTRRQTSTFDFCSKKLTDRIVSHLLYSKFTWLVVWRIGHVWSAHLVDLRKWVGHICTWCTPAAIIRNIRHYCRVASTLTWVMRNILLIFLLLLGMLAPLLVRSRRFSWLKCFEHLQVLLVDLLYLFLAVREVESSWGARHRHQHATVPLIWSLLARIIAQHASIAGMLTWMRHLIEQLLLLHHVVVLIVQAKAMQAIRSHALLTSARLPRLRPDEFADSAACKDCRLSRARLRCDFWALVQFGSQFQLWIMCRLLSDIRKLPIRCITHIQTCRRNQGTTRTWVYHFRNHIYRRRFRLLALIAIALLWLCDGFWKAYEALIFVLLPVQDLNHLIQKDGVIGINLPLPLLLNTVQWLVRNSWLALLSLMLATRL